MRLAIGSVASSLLLASALSFIVALALNTNRTHAAENVQCVDFSIVFARGSGQSLDGEEFKRFKQRFDEQLPPSSGITKTIYELGTEFVNGYRYEAISVQDPVKHAIDAKITDGQGSDYGRSVGNGTMELASYLVKEGLRCPGTKFVFAGYSQGAQVIGQELGSYPKELKDRIIFVALFGDPKLHLPEGWGIDPPACHGKNYSAWRRAIGNCKTSGGSLKSREPYLPDDMRSKTGLWCNAADYVCGSSNYLWDQSGHGKYKDVGNGIDQAVNEITRKIYLTSPKYKLIDSRYLLNSPRRISGNSDVIIILDGSLGMNPYISTAKAQAYTIANKVFASGGRVALYISSLTTSILPIGQTTAGCMHLSQPFPIVDIMGPAGPSMVLETIGSTALVDCDYPLPDGAGIDYALIRNKQFGYWRDGADRIIVLLTNAPYGLASAQVHAADTNVLDWNAEAQAITLYPVVPPEIVSTFSNLQENHADLLTRNYDTPDESVNALISRINAQVMATLSGTDYRARPGDNLAFDASGSYIIDDAADRYEWDFDGDAISDQTTTTPTVQHTYLTDFNGTMNVRVVTKSGLSDIASASVKIEANPIAPQRSKAPTNLQIKITSPTSVQLSWTPADGTADSWAISSNGLIIGRSPNTQNYVDIDDVSRTEDIEFGVAAVTSDLLVGESVTITLERESESPSFQNKVFAALKAFSQVTVQAAKANASSLDSGTATEQGNTEGTKPQTTAAHQRQNTPWLLYAAGGTLIAAGATTAAIIIRKRTNI